MVMGECRREGNVHIYPTHREGTLTPADGTILMGFLDHFSFFLLEPAEDNKVRLTQCELAINLSVPETEI